jgi:transposase
LPAAAQAALRNRAVRAVLNSMTQAQAARVFGVHHNAVNRWIKRYRQGGWAGLAERRRGRRPGEQAALSEPQQQELMALVRDATPDQLGLAGLRWTREAVAELIGRRDGLLLARTTGGWVATRLGLQPPAAPAAGPGAAPGRGAPLAGRDLSRYPRPGQARGRAGVVAG